MYVSPEDKTPEQILNENRILIKLVRYGLSREQYDELLPSIVAAMNEFAEQQVADYRHNANISEDLAS